MAGALRNAAAVFLGACLVPVLLVVACVMAARIDNGNGRED